VRQKFFRRGKSGPKLATQAPLFGHREFRTSTTRVWCVDCLLGTRRDGTNTEAFMLRHVTTFCAPGTDGKYQYKYR
jgi:hypothetical protein